MLNFLRDLLRAMWRVVLVVPMPWRAELITWITVLVGYQVIYRILVLSLLPEFWITNRLRHWKLKSLPGTYAFDSLIEWSIEIFRVLRWVAFLVAVLGIIAWYLQPLLEDATFTQYMNQLINWWYSLEEKVLAGR